MPRKNVTRNVALCYVRQSFTKDEKDTISPDRQSAHIQAVCEGKGWLPEWYEDVDGHKSGMHEKNRPGWLALKSRMSDPDVIAIVTNDLARLHRKGWRIGDLLDFVDQHNIELVLADPARQMDFAAPHGRIFAQLTSIMDEYYVADVSARWKSDIAYRKSKGITVGLTPFGTKRDSGGYLMPTDEGAWLLPDGAWIAGKLGEPAPAEGARWRGYYELAGIILKLYASRTAGRTRIAELLHAEGWAWRDRRGNPAPLETEDIRRVTNNWPEYGGAVIGKRARERHPDDYDPETIALNSERAVFDVDMLREVGRVQRERTIQKVKRGRPSIHPYPLSGLVWCAHCEALAKRHENPKLRSKLSAKSQRRYRHMPGVACGCINKSVLRETLETSFVDLVKRLAIHAETTERIKTSGAQFGHAQNEQERNWQQEAAIARNYRRIEAVRHLYADGEINREEYLKRKTDAEREIAQWELMNGEAERILAQLTVAMDTVFKIGNLWTNSSDEEKQGLARMLFDGFIYDLDEGGIVDFKLKKWAEGIFTLEPAINS